ncbi:hypothetical protein LB58_18775 [Salmonella enterica]|nr:hypothetical protein [Salmonella enterica]
MMVNQIFMVITHDTFLRQSISVLMKQLCCENRTCFIDVDSFNSLGELNDILYQLSKEDSIRTILISRGLWLSQVISSEIDLSVYDDLYKWQYLITIAKPKSVSNVIEKIEYFKDLKGMSQCEVKTIQSLKLSESIILAAKKSGVNYKNFLRRTHAIARRYNLKNTANLHFFIYRFNK